jgi:hypothetical protein
LRFNPDKLGATRTFSQLASLERPLLDFLVIGCHHQGDDEADRSEQEAEGKSATTTSALVAKDYPSGHAAKDPDNQ